MMKFWGYIVFLVYKGKYKVVRVERGSNFCVCFIVILGFILRWNLGKGESSGF